MKFNLTLILTLLMGLLLGSASETLAAGVRYDNSSVFVWGFLALCAMIALAQVLPMLGRVLQRTTEEEAKRKVELGTSTTRRRAA